MKSSNKKLIITAYVLVITFMLLIVASQAWMNISQMPSLSEITMNIVMDNKLVIADDVDGNPGEWDTKIFFLDLPDGSEMKPVTFSAAKGEFLAPRYGWDGRTDLSKPILLSDIANNRPDTTTADMVNGHMFVKDFWIKSEWSDCKVFLDPAEVHEINPEGDGTYLSTPPLWNSMTVSHYMNSCGADSALRFAFYLHPNADYPEGYFVIYEPNYDGKTNSIDFDDQGNNLPYNGEYKIIKQQRTTFEEIPDDQGRIVHGSYKYVPGKFIDSSELFELKYQEENKVTLFLWMEGQDADCTNSISGCEIVANIQFFSETFGRYIGPGDEE